MEIQKNLIIFNLKGEGALGVFHIFLVQYHDKGLPAARLSVLNNVVPLPDGDLIGAELKPEGKHIGRTEGAKSPIPIFQGLIIVLIFRVGSRQHDLAIHLLLVFDRPYGHLYEIGGVIHDEAVVKALLRHIQQGR